MPNLSHENVPAGINGVIVFKSIINQTNSQPRPTAVIHFASLVRPASAMIIDTTKGGTTRKAI